MPEFRFERKGDQLCLLILSQGEKEIKPIKLQNIINGKEVPITIPRCIIHDDFGGYPFIGIPKEDEDTLDFQDINELEVLWRYNQ